MNKKLLSFFFFPWLTVIPIAIGSLLPTFSSAQVIATGGFQSLAICTDGTAQSWGFDASGQLGDGGANTNQPTPVAVSSLTAVTAIVGGYVSSYALKSDGTVWSWGDDTYGELGNDVTLVDKTSPVAVSLTGTVIAIASEGGGGGHALALKNTGTIWAWGENQFGELGDNSTTNRSTPVAVSTLTGVMAIAAGGEHSLALKSDGTVWAWGWNSHGQVGDGTTTNRKTPIQVGGLAGITAISGGGTTSFALKSDGTLWSWGYNNHGQLGDNTTTERRSPVAVTITGTVTAISGGLQHTLALKNDGTVWAWGDDVSFGQLGDDAAAADKYTPVPVATITNITAIAAGYGQSFGVKNNGTLWAWGRDAQGQLGDDAPLVQQNTPVQVTGACYILPLPIELLDFTATAENNEKVRCDWQTVTEMNSDFFVVLRSQDGYNFSQIGQVSTQAFGGYSNVPLYYIFYDDNPHMGVSYYRLKQVDKNGKYIYSPIRSVYIGAIDIISIYPNPSFNGYIEYIVGNEEESSVAVQLVDVLGRVVMSKQEILEKGINTKQISTANLSSGPYLIRIIQNSKEKIQKQFLIK